MKKATALLILCSVLASLTACGTDDKSTSQAGIKTDIVTEAPTEPPTTEPPFDTEAFKKRISDFDETICNASILLMNAIKYQANYLKALTNFGSSASSEEMYQNAVEFLLEKADEDMNMSETKLEDDYKVICKEYADITAEDPNTQDLSAIREAYEKLYDGYTAMYMVVTSPPTSTSSYSCESGDALDNFNDADTKLKAYLN